ncbi:major facilitator superfamily domain-containing protein [Aspergillus cavernicola]|uniref:Major facilitator superfamily domain-containing protein n=1 Tax=Aspergillus cavernicola TaxID=176166 RepID=A0ABR4HQK4_9EURO
MRQESIEIGYAEDSFRAHLHENTSTQNLVDAIYLEDTSSYDSETDLESVVWRPKVKESLILTCVSLVAMLDAFDATMMIPIIPVLSTVFEKPIRSILWVDTSYFLANAASQPLFAMLSEVFGQGPILIVAVVIATAGTGVCSGSLSVPCLVAGRLAQGAGNGGAMAVSILLVTDLTPYPHRVRFSEYICRAWVLGAILGPLSGVLFGKYGNWNWTFYFSYIFCSLSLLVIPFAVDLRECKSISRHAAREMDWLGAIFTLLGIGSLLIGVSWVGGQPSRWDDWRILVTTCTGGLAMIVLVLYESVWVVQPMFNRDIFNSISTIMLYVGSLLHGLLILCHLQNLSMYTFLVRPFYSPLTGLSILAILAPALPILLIMAKLGMSSHPSRLRWIIRAGWVLNLLASACFILLDGDTPTPGWVFIFFATGISHALLISGYHTSSHSESPAQKREEQEEHQQARRGRSSSTAFAILMYSIFRTWGMSIAVPVSGAIVLTQMAQGVGGDLGSSSGSLVQQDGVMLSQDNKEEMGRLFLDGFRVAWRFFMGVSALGGISSLLVRVFQFVPDRNSSPQALVMRIPALGRCDPLPGATVINRESPRLVSALHLSFFLILPHLPHTHPYQPSFRFHIDTIFTRLSLLASSKCVSLRPFFNELLWNITRLKEGFVLAKEFEKEYALRSLETILAQKELHAAIANRALKHFGQKPIRPCHYTFPVTSLDEAINLATLFSSLHLGGLQDITERFAANGDAFLARLTAAMIGKEGAQQGWFRVYLDKFPSELPLLTTSDINFVYSAAQNHVVPGSCPDNKDINLKAFAPLEILTPPVPKSSKIRISWTHGSNEKYDLLWLAYINQLNVPAVVPVQVLSCDGQKSTAVALFPYDEFLLNGLTVAAVVNRRGPFVNAAEVAQSTVYGPGLIIVE